MATCLFNNSFEITYSYGGHDPSLTKHLYYEDVIQVSRCCLLKPEWFIPSADLKQADDVMQLLWNLPDKKNAEVVHLNHPMCAGQDCTLEPNNAVRELIVGLSYACNLNCYHCWYAGNHFDTAFQKELYFHVLNHIKGHKLDKLTLTNKGEPFFYLAETMEYLRGFSERDAACVSCITNGNCISTSQIEELATLSQDNGYSFNFTFSIDAISKAVYDRVRFGGDFDKVLKNLEQCVKYFGTENVSVSFCTKKPNFNEAFQAREFFAHNFGLRTDISVDYYDQELLKKTVISH